MVSSVLAEAILSQQAPDIVGSFKAGREEARQEQVKTLAGQALKEGGGQALDELKGIDQEVAMALGEKLNARSASDINDFVRDAGIGERLLMAGDVAGAASFARQRMNTLAQQGRSTEQTAQILHLIENDPATALDHLKAFSGVLKNANQLTGQSTARQKEFEQFAEMEEGSEKEQFGRLIGAVAKDPLAKGLSAGLEKRLFEAQDAAVAAGGNVRELDALASDFDREIAAGTASTISEFFKGVTGSQDEASELRRRFNKVRLSEALKFLPPGPATDKDVEEAFRGVPKESAPATQVQSFLRGASKLAKFDAEFQQFKADYISQEGTATGMLKAWRDKVKDGDVASLANFGEAEQEAQPVEQTQAAPQAAPQTIGRFTVRVK